LEEQQELEKLLQELRESSHTKIVEGKKDKTALNKLGITNVVTCSRSMQEAAAVSTDPAIILTDYDEDGRRMASRLVELLHDEGKTADLDYRRKLRKITRITRVEELPKAIERGEKDGKNLC